MGDKDALRVGIVGAGGIAPPHIDGWLALGAEVSILRRTGAQELADLHGIRVIDDLDQLIDQSTIIDIISPTTTHLDIARRAFAAGRDVVCEKPLAVTTADAVALAQAASDAGMRLFPAHVVRYFEGYRLLKEQIATIGTLLELTFRRTVPAPDAAWFFAEDAGGGLIRDLMIHDLDQALWLAGPVAEISATQDPPSTDGQVMPPVSAHATLTHANGAISHVRADWFGPETVFRSQAQVVGADGSLEFDTAGSGGRREGYLPPASDIDPYQAQLADFVDALRTGHDARVTPEDGIAAVRLVDAAYESLRTGRPVLL
ncbi:Gfo/Idh/MocA family oxidoreductase [Microbacterium sp. H1-D42]|uniref:Gfo/Idh/MocA family protein n=1 Tax=Microbacterium sp. H1-D42 TaxID=2925844 RepID=UPI001F53C8E2|nr:Gfo/Idh/MocA family oxidoreductase [Microbacterium sp. H1-D42]UNK70760.1 Gfo/Idh/MocA family oxidoreductase [Microbacterium sp. H1-D42]